MPADERYLRQVGLLVRVLPFVAEERCFALKGGTAINLFVRDLPRLSVDIDLAYLPIEDRRASLHGIEAALGRIGARIEHAVPSCRVNAVTLRTEGTVNRLFVRDRGVQVKIEVTPVLRGCVYEPERRTVSAGVEERFGFAAMQLVSFPDLYAGKLVAALDRQHPRDLFDLRGLLSNEGVDERLRTAFVVYVISHGRPIAELLAPRKRELAAEFARGLAGMVETPVALDDLIRGRGRRSRRRRWRGCRRHIGALWFRSRPGSRTSRCWRCPRRGGCRRCAGGCRTWRGSMRDGERNRRGGWSGRSRRPDGRDGDRPGNGAAVGNAGQRTGVGFVGRG